MLGPFQHDRPRPGGRRRARRGQSGRPGTDDGDIPLAVFVFPHRAILEDPGRPPSAPARL
jgi:hypothetical protein